MDPDIDIKACKITTLQSPIPPTPEDINPHKATLNDLDDIEDKRFRLLKKDYEEDLGEYKGKHKAVGVMRTRIQEIVSRKSTLCP